MLLSDESSVLFIAAHLLMLLFAQTGDETFHRIGSGFKPIISKAQLVPPYQFLLHESHFTGLSFRDLLLVFGTRVSCIASQHMSELD